MTMQTVTSREVQNRYGDFIDTLQDDVVCVTRHGRPLYWALADRYLREKDPSVFIGRMILLRAQLAGQNGGDTESLDSFLKTIDASLKDDTLSVHDVNTIVDANRR